jgi:hypothetical protein
LADSAMPTRLLLLRLSACEIKAPTRIACKQQNRSVSCY